MIIVKISTVILAIILFPIFFYLAFVVGKTIGKEEGFNKAHGLFKGERKNDTTKANDKI